MKKELKELRKPIWKFQLLMVGTVVVCALFAICIPYGWIASILIALIMGYAVIRKKIPDTVIGIHNRLQFFNHYEYIHWLSKNSKDELNKIIKFLSANSFSIQDVNNGVLIMPNKFELKYWPYCKDENKVNCKLNLFDKNNTLSVPNDVYLYKDNGIIKIKNFNDFTNYTEKNYE